jgi:hypothetical protein
MRSFKLLAAATVASALLASPALARDGYGYRGGFGPGLAAGVAIGTVGALAAAPYRDSYDKYGGDYDAPSAGYYEPHYGYSRGGRSGQTWNSTAGAGGYNTDATRLDYNR